MYSKYRESASTEWLPSLQSGLPICWQWLGVILTSSILPHTPHLSQVVSSKLNLVDLAGSERLKKALDQARVGAAFGENAI